MPFRFFCSISMYGTARLLNRYLNLVFFDIHDAVFIIAAARCTRAIIKGKKIGTKACLFVMISIAGNCSKIFLKKSFALSKSFTYIAMCSIFIVISFLICVLFIKRIPSNET